MNWIITLILVFCCNPQAEEQYDRPKIVSFYIFATLRHHQKMWTFENLFNFQISYFRAHCPNKKHSKLKPPTHCTDVQGLQKGTAVGS